METRYENTNLFQAKYLNDSISLTRLIVSLFIILNVVVPCTLAETKEQAKIGRFDFTTRVGSKEITNPVNYASYAISATDQPCGATLIAADILLTAAHCKGKFLEGAYIGGNSHDGNGGEFMTVLKEIPHPLYAKVRNQKYDIMLVKLSQPSKAPKQKINYQKSAGQSTRDAVKSITFAAQGRSFLVAYSMVELSIKVIDIAICAMMWKKYDYSPEFVVCAGSKTGGVNVCDGDTGGPLLLSGSNEQIGILSSSQSCPNSGTPNVYTRISAHQTFIKNAICENSEKKPTFC